MDFVWFILIGLIAGWLAGQVMKGGGFGVVGDIVVGVVGAVLGGYLFRLLGLSAGGLIGSLIVATIGAIVLIFLIRLVKRHPAFRRGTFEILHPVNRKIFAFVREFQDDALLAVSNLSRFSQAVELDLHRFHGWTPTELFGDTPFPKIGELPYPLTFGPHGFFWFKLVPPPRN